MNLNFFKKKTAVEYVNYDETAEIDENAMFGTTPGESSESDLPDFEFGGDDHEEGRYIEIDEVPPTVYKKTAQWVLLLGAVLVPLFFLPWTSGILELNKQMLLVAIAGVGLILWLLDVVMSGRLSWVHNKLDKGILALLGAAVLATIFSVSKFKSIFGSGSSLSESFVAISALTIIYFLVVNSFDDEGKKIRLFFSISIIAVLLYGLLQMLGVYVLSLLRYLDIGIFDFTAASSFNTVGSVNALGILAAVALPMLYRANISIFRRVDISRIGALAALAVLVVLNWWVLWVVAVAGMVSVVVFESFLAKPRNGFHLSGFVFPMVVIVLGVFLVIVNFNLVFVKNNLPVEIAPSYGLSAKVVSETLQKEPVFGYGPENFSVAFDKHGAGELRNSGLPEARFFDSNAHVLNIAVHNGLVGLAALVFLLWLLVAGCWSLFRNMSKFRNADPPTGRAGISSEDTGIMSSVAAAVTAMFFYPFNLTLIFTFYLLMALFVLVVWKDRKILYNIEDKASLSLVSSLGFIGGLILSLVGIYFASVNYFADVKYAKALVQTDVQSALNEISSAINWNARDDRYYRLASQVVLNLLSKELNAQPVTGDSQRNTRVQNYLSSSVALARRATEISPLNSNNWINLGNIYQNLLPLVSGTDVLAESAYLKAYESRPGDPTIYNRVGNMYLVNADLLRQKGQNSAEALAKAEEYFRKAVDVSNNYGLAIYNLGIVYERQGKLNEAIKQLERIAPFNSNQPGLAFELGLLYYRANQKSNALGQLQRAVVLSPDYANARWYLALIYEERNEVELAVEQLEAILGTEANKDNEMVTQKLNDLKAGRINTPPTPILDRQPL